MYAFIGKPNLFISKHRVNISYYKIALFIITSYNFLFISNYLLNFNILRDYLVTIPVDKTTIHVRITF